MTEHQLTRLPRILRLIAFVAFFTTLLIYSPNVMVIQSHEVSDYTEFFAEPCLIISFIASVLIVVISLVRPGMAQDHRIIRATMIIGAILYFIGVAGYAIVTFGQYDSAPTWNRIFAVCAGIGVLPMCISWSYSFHELDLHHGIFVIAVAGGCSALCNLALTNMTRLPAEVIFIVLLVCGVCWPLWQIIVAKRPAIAEVNVVVIDPDIRTSAPSRTSDPEVGSPAQRMSVRAFLSVMGLSLLGMIIASFAMGVQPAYLFDGQLDVQRISMIIGAVALLPLVFLVKTRPLYSYIYQIYLPIVAVIAIVLCAFPADIWVRDVALVVVYTFFIMVCGVAIAIAIATANAREFPRSVVFATIVGVFSGMAILGIFLGGQIDNLIDMNDVVIVILTAVYGGILLLTNCVRSWHLTVRPADRGELKPAYTSPEAETADATAPETFEERLGRLAAETGLSPRETQIIGYIGRGHSSVYVAKTLLISESTVYSHVRNIYRKLGISSREELIQLLNETGEADDDGAGK